MMLPLPVEPLDYRTPAAGPGRWRWWKVALGVGIGVAVGAFITLPALFLSIVSAGGGHGDYFAARLFYPLVLCAMSWVGSSESLLVALALLQFPLYGAIIGYGAAVGWRALVVSVVAVGLCHGIGLFIFFYLH